MELTLQLAGLLGALYLISVLLAYVIGNRKSRQQLGDYASLREALKDAKEKHQRATTVLGAVTEKVEAAKSAFRDIDADTKALQQLRDNAQNIKSQLERDQAELQKIDGALIEHRRQVESQESSLHELMAKLDLYSRVEEFTEYGHFEMPEYLYETGERFAAEIKALREKQKQLIKSGEAFTQDGTVSLTGDDKTDKKIIDGQMKVIMRAFNIETDLLIGKVTPSSFERTLSRIEKVANDLEKCVASLYCGFNSDYVALKYEECGLQYQHTLKKRDEQEEQKLIREQMREEARAEKEYRDALAAAEKEEQLYRDLLEKARIELGKASEEERALAEAKIAGLEQQLAEAEAKEERAKSLAQQTRRGHVYVISNIGSFGKNVYKIGMTRRLDPMDRVKELGDASVPFTFDVHAIIFADDAPALETELHRAFSHHRVNAVNLRKEFFRVALKDIRDTVAALGVEEADFKTTIAAEEYYETQRLRERSLPAPEPG